MRISLFMRVTMLLLLTLLSAGLSGQEKKSPAEEKKWEVSQPHGPADTVSFTVDEGTWMNLDVSPDGKEIVFDLLGDIYRLPIEGGEAHLLRGGPAFEVQPRFSPDGQKISFTSDHGGADNIWMMNRDGSEARQVTEEDFRLLNNAVWTPDGQYLIARKHFTSRRSLGAGEMWMYHFSGGKGVQLTKRKNDQQDAGEPCLSPDGRYLYFSEDMSGGSTFQYNKDPNTQIYVIRRLDLKTGKLINYITGQGGAVRPQVSPDGEYLSFVRRIRGKSVLFVQRLATGELWPVYEQLSKDQQEAWAIFGVYSNYNWLPNNREIVIWAEGKIWRVDIHSRAARQIPFQVAATHIIAKALRFHQQADSSFFQTRMIRQAVTSPDGKFLVFQAVGHLWKMRLPNGTPQRLTRDHGWFEFEPSFSPEGKTVVYTTWSDTALGSIRTVPIRGGRSAKLTRRKGRFYSPRYSPDGTMITYRRERGDFLLGFTYAVDPGIYWMAANGGDENFVIDEGHKPHFSADGSRIYYFLDGGKQKTLKSVQLDGLDPRILFTSKYATDIVISPDERWVAFQELFNAYVIPFPHTPKTLDLSSKNKALPLTRVTRDAGNYLHWSGDSRKLHWVIGPEYFTRDLSELFSFVEGAPDSLPGPPEVGLPIKLILPADRPEGQLALEGARIITMKGEQIIEDGVILIEENRIAAVGPRDSLEILPTARRIDVSGKTIIPGLIDVHAHAWHFSRRVTPQQHWPYFANLAYGITTMHDPSANTDFVFSLAELVKAGEITGPRVFSTGTILYGAEGDFKAVINNLEDARSHLRRMKAVGAFSVKSYNQPRRNQRQQVIRAARELHMNVYPEGGSFFFHNLSMVLDGHTGIEHNVPVTPLFKDVLDLWGASESGYTPTLVVAYGSQSGERYWYQHSQVWKKHPLLNFVPRALVDARARRRSMAPDEEYGHFSNARDAKALLDAGVRVNIGGHGQMQGLAPHWELWMFVQGGMTPLEALRCATLNGAYYLGMEDQLGSIEPGKLADLAVLEKNPLEDIQNSETVLYVIKNGRIYDTSTMNEIGNHPRKRMPFWWELPNSGDAAEWRSAAGFQPAQCSCGRH